MICFQKRSASANSARRQTMWKATKCISKEENSIFVFIIKKIVDIRNDASSLGSKEERERDIAAKPESKMPCGQRPEIAPILISAKSGLLLIWNARIGAGLEAEILE
jgi:hypothetical protein